MPGDADATRRRLLAAATEEFAAHGLAGARVDRIAAAARSNKAQIYHYFGSKDRLFDAVWEALVKQIVQAVPIDVDDLSSFAARLSDTYAQHPELVRLITWQRLERGDDPPHDFAVSSTQANVEAIAIAQAADVIPGHFEARVLFALIIHIAALWGMTSPDVLAVVDLADPDRRREIVRSAARALLAERSSRSRPPRRHSR
jgi:AcrR family transcriptional regulator